MEVISTYLTQVLTDRLHIQTTVSIPYYIIKAKSVCWNTKFLISDDKHSQNELDCTVLGIFV